MGAGGLIIGIPRGWFRIEHWIARFGKTWLAAWIGDASILNIARRGRRSSRASIAARVGDAVVRIARLREWIDQAGRAVRAGREITSATKSWITDPIGDGGLERLEKFRWPGKALAKIFFQGAENHRLKLG